MCMFVILYVVVGGGHLQLSLSRQIIKKNKTQIENEIKSKSKPSITQKYHNLIKKTPPFQMVT